MDNTGPFWHRLDWGFGDEINTIYLELQRWLLAVLEPGGEKSLVDGVGLGVEVGHGDGGVQHLPNIGHIVEDGSGEVGDGGAEGGPEDRVLAPHTLHHVAGRGQDRLQEQQIN